MPNVKLGLKQQFILDSKKLTVELGGKAVTVSGNVFNRPGEYEVGGVEVVYGNQAALLIWEKIQIVYLFSVAKVAEFEKTHFSPCDVLMIDGEIGELSKHEFGDLLETYDPAIVIISGKTATAELTGSYKVQTVETVKFNYQTLPSEGREILALGG